MLVKLVCNKHEDSLCYFIDSFTLFYVYMLILHYFMFLITNCRLFYIDLHTAKNIREDIIMDSFILFYTADSQQ